MVPCSLTSPAPPTDGPSAQFQAKTADSVTACATWSGPWPRWPGSRTRGRQAVRCLLAAIGDRSKRPRRRSRGRRRESRAPRRGRRARRNPAPRCRSLRSDVESDARGSNQRVFLSPSRKSDVARRTYLRMVRSLAEDHGLEVLDFRDTLGGTFVDVSSLSPESPAMLMDSGQTWRTACQRLLRSLSKIGTRRAGQDLNATPRAAGLASTGIPALGPPHDVGLDHRLDDGPRRSTSSPAKSSAVAVGGGAARGRSRSSAPVTVPV